MKARSQKILIKEKMFGKQDIKTERRKQASLSKLFYSFLQGTTAHGLPKVVTSESWTRKLIWLSVFCLAFGYFTYQCTVLIQYYLEYPVSVSIDVATTQTMRFPAVTVCNMNMLKKDAVAMDNKYKDLVEIDDYFQYTMQSQLNDINLVRKRRGISTRSEESHDDRFKKKRLIREWKNAAKLAAGGRKKPHQSQPNKLIFKSLNPKYRGVESNSKSPGKVNLQEDNLDQVLPYYLPGFSNVKSIDQINMINIEETPIESDLLPLKSRDTREADDSSGDYDNWISWFANDSEYNIDGTAAYNYFNYDNSWDYDDEYWQDFQFEDYGFAGRIKSEEDFKEFMKLSKTDDYSDLIDVLKPSRQDLDAYGHQASDFIIQCSFNKMNCSYLDFLKVYNPTYGLCYVFNHGTENSSVKVTNKFGSRYGLRLALNIEYDQYLGLFSHKAGARVAVHSNGVMAFPEDFGVSAAPGQETEIGVSQETITRQPAPYPSNCTDGTAHALAYDGNYTITACSMTCLQRNLKKRCGCTDRLVVDASELSCSVVNATQEACRQKVYHLYDINKLECDCPPSCQENVFKMYTSSSKWPSSPYQYILAAQLVKANEDLLYTDLLERIQKTMLGIHVYLADPILVTIDEYPSYTWDRLLADIGGLLGLFIGVSACTAFEVLEFAADATLLLGIFLFKKQTAKVQQFVRDPPLDEITLSATRQGIGHQ